MDETIYIDSDENSAYKIRFKKDEKNEKEELYQKTELGESCLYCSTVCYKFN